MMILPLLLVAAKLVSGAAAAAAAVAVVTICFDQVMRNLRREKVHSKDIGKLVKEHLDNGKVRVVGSVLSNRPLGIFPRHVRYEEVFSGKLDPQLEALFGGKERVNITL